MDKAYQLQRALLGYAAGAGLAVLVIAVSVGPVAGAFAFLVGAGLAVACGIFVFLPIVLLLIWMGQLRIWWIVLLSPALLLAGGYILSPPGESWLNVVLARSDGGLTVNWQAAFAAAFAACCGLVGWVVGFGFRVRPQALEDEAD
ncbi:hypothetical protein [Pelagibius sp.]|uniref:hypothetical protein n=1 Tax=Pelagibius sp. TaxID=1931238 RepID=UPI003B511EDB